MPQKQSAYWTPAAVVLLAGSLAAGYWVYTGTRPAPVLEQASVAAQPAQPAAAQPAPRSPRFGSAQPLPKPAGAVRLAAYNVENLFRDEPGETPDPERQPHKPDAHVRAAADAIRDLDADILALQEVESLAVLTWFRDTHLQGLGYDHIASIDAGDGRGIEQAVLSRFPITSAQNWPDLRLEGNHPPTTRDPEASPGMPIAFRRSPLRADVTVPADRAGGAPYTLTLFVVHHKSGRDSGYWREAEARKVVELTGQILAENPAANIAVLGDFNASVVDASFKIYLDAGWIDAGADRKPGQPDFVTHESGRTIDFILLSPTLRPELVPGSKFVLGTPARPAGVDWRTFPPPEGYASDHYPISVDLLPRDAPPAGG